MTTAQRNMAEMMLMALLDNKNLKPNQKQITKNMLVPMLEFIDDTYNPEETAKSMMMLTRFISFAIAYAIMLCTQPTEMARTGHMKFVVKHFEESLKDGLELFVEAHKTGVAEALTEALKAEGRGGGH